MPLFLELLLPNHGEEEDGEVMEEGAIGVVVGEVGDVSDDL